MFINGETATWSPPQGAERQKKLCYDLKPSPRSAYQVTAAKFHPNFTESNVRPNLHPNLCPNLRPNHWITAQITAQTSAQFFAQISPKFLITRTCYQKPHFLLSKNVGAIRERSWGVCLGLDLGNDLGRYLGGDLASDLGRDSGGNSDWHLGRSLTSLYDIGKSEWGKLFPSGVSEITSVHLWGLPEVPNSEAWPHSLAGPTLKGLPKVLKLTEQTYF